MSKQSSSLADSNSNQVGIWQLAGGRVISVIITLILVVLIWLFMQQVIPAGKLIAWWVVLLIILLAALTMAIERALVALALSLSWRYRIAFLGSIVVFLGIWVLIWLASGAAFSPSWLLPAVFGTFLGCILATNFNEGLWENNSPPSQEVMQDVYQQHQSLIGKPDPVPTLKRAFDISLAAFGLLLSLPVWFLSIFVIWLEDPGPLLFVKNSVGRGGYEFSPIQTAHDGARRRRFNRTRFSQRKR